MGATLANEGVNPITNKRVLAAEHIPELLALMATTGSMMNRASGNILRAYPRKQALAVALLP